MATLVGVAAARPTARPEGSPALLNHVISAHHCIPIDGDYDWAIVEDHLECPAPPCNFVCAINPPHQGVIRAQRLAMYAYDHAGGRVCTNLVQVYPRGGTWTSRLGVECTTNNAADPRVYAYNPANFLVQESTDLYVWVSVTGNLLKVYGFQLRYEPL